MPARAWPQARVLQTLLIFAGRERGSLRNIDASGGEGFLHDMVQTAGGADVLADMPRQSVMMSTEMVLTRAPEVILELRTATDDLNPDVRAWEALPSRTVTQESLHLHYRARREFSP